MLSSWDRDQSPAVREPGFFRARLGVERPVSAAEEFELHSGGKEEEEERLKAGLALIRGVVS